MPEVVKNEKEKEAEEVVIPDEVIIQEPQVMKKVESKEIRNLPFPNRLKKQADDK